MLATDAGFDLRPRGERAGLDVTLFCEGADRGLDALLLEAARDAARGRSRLADRVTIRPGRRPTAGSRSGSSAGGGPAGASSPSAIGSR
jgi:hypothetical protein